MIVRRAAVVLAGITAAAFMTVGAATAAPLDGGSAVGGKGAADAAVSYENLGGPWGITRAHGTYHETIAFFAINHY